MRSGGAMLNHLKYEDNRNTSIKLMERIEFLVLERAYHLYKGDDKMVDFIQEEIDTSKSKLNIIWDQQVELFFKINK